MKSRNPWDKNYQSFPKMPGDWLFKVVPFFIAGVFVLIALIWVGMVVLGMKAAKSDCVPALIKDESGGQTQYTVGCKESR